MEIKITPPVVEDAQGIMECVYKSWLDTYPNEEIGITKDDIEDKFKNLDEKVERQKQRIINTPENEKRIVAKCDGVVVGCANLVLNEHNNQLGMIYILPEYQRRGIGHMLWSELKKYCIPDKSTIVEVATYNIKAIEFYKKLGFVDTGKRFTEEKTRMKSGALIPEMEMEIKAEN